MYILYLSYENVINKYKVIYIILCSGCIASCENDHIFPNGADHLAILCKDANWNIVGTEWSTIPHCERMFLFFFLFFSISHWFLFFFFYKIYILHR